MQTFFSTICLSLLEFANFFLKSLISSSSSFIFSSVGSSAYKPLVLNEEDSTSPLDVFFQDSQSLTARLH
jgi:hypothetical protein